MENNCASHGIVDTIITTGKNIAADSNHLSTSSSLTRQPHGCPNAMSVVKSMTKNETLRARSSGRRSELVDIYFLLIKFKKLSICLSRVTSTPSTSFPEYLTWFQLLRYATGIKLKIAYTHCHLRSLLGMDVVINGWEQIIMPNLELLSCVPLCSCVSWLRWTHMLDQIRITCQEDVRPNTSKFTWI